MVLRAMFLVVGVVLGLSLGWSLSDGQTEMLLIGALVGAVVGAAILAAEQRLQSVPLPVVIWGGVGLTLSFVGRGIDWILNGPCWKFWANDLFFAGDVGHIFRDAVVGTERWDTVWQRSGCHSRTRHWKMVSSL